MPSFNKVILIGNMTADPELKQTAAGTSVCSFSIAVNRRFAKAEQGQQNVDYINIQTWRQTAEFVSRYFKKGKPILVCGQLQTRSWTDNQNQKRYATEVVADEVSFVGESAPEPQKHTPANNAGYTQNALSFLPRKETKFEELPSDDDLPF